MMGEKIPKGWKKVKLGDYIEIKHGYAFKGENITEKETSNILVTPGNFYIGGGFKKEKLKYYKGKVPKEYILEENDIIVTMTDLSRNSDTLGYSAKIPKSLNGEKYLHNQRIGLVIFKNADINRDYLYWMMRTKEYHWYIVSSASGTSIMHTSPSRIENYQFYLPPLAEQKAIAEVLSSIDDKIDLLHRQNKTLENIAESIFKKMFQQPSPNLSQRERNKEWEKKSLNEIAIFLNGLPCQKFPPKNDKEKLPVLKIKELKSGINENSDWATSDVPQEYIVENGDVVFSWSGSLYVKIWDGERCVLNQHLFKVSSDIYPKWFYYLWIKFYLNKFLAIAESKATTMGHIKREDLSNSVVYVPPHQELAVMDKYMGNIFDKIILNNNQIRTLEKLRDTLLPKLMSGEVRVKV